MPRQPYRTLDDLDVEDLGVFEYLDDETWRFVPNPAPPVARPGLNERLDERLRVELPMLWGWIFLSCFFHDAWPWMLWGAGLIAINSWLRPAYEQRKLGWLFRVYTGAGAGQMVAGLGLLVDLGPIRPLLGFYLVGLVLVWIVLELRYQARVPIEPDPDIYDQVYYS